MSSILKELVGRNKHFYVVMVKAPTKIKYL